MTAREFIQRRRDQANQYSAFIVAGPLLVLGRFGHFKHRYLALAVVMLICWIVAYRTDMRRTPCLHCAAPLGDAAAAALAVPPRANQCPHCGINLDE